MKEAVVKLVLNAVLGNKVLLFKTFIFLAEIIVKRTDNELDDEFLALVKDNLGKLTSLSK